MGKLSSVDACAVGMEVRHKMTSGRGIGLGDGEIIAIVEHGVIVYYPLAGACGMYDDAWFRGGGSTLEWIE